MPLYRLKGRRIERIQPLEQRLKEEFVHRLIEDNLGTFFEDLLLVARKPRIGGKEFDTLALDTATNAPVIIEYKREKGRGVVEQADLYYIKLKHNKSDVMVLLQKADAIEDLGQVDFENPQMIVVAKEFTREQRELLAMKKNYLRLFRYQIYAGGVLSIEQVEPLGAPSELGEGAHGGLRISEGPYDLDHFGMSSETRKLHEHLDKAVLSLDSRVKPGKINKYFIGYGATGSYFCSVKPRVNSIKVEVKCARRRPHAKGLEVQPVPVYQDTPLTHVFQISSENQVKAALPVIKAALESSM